MLMIVLNVLVRGQTVKNCRNFISHSKLRVAARELIIEIFLKKSVFVFESMTNLHILCRFIPIF